ncbi:MAG: hypothetical protein RIM84_17885 [Alphaproteobacteria bacterium]
MSPSPRVLVVSTVLVMLLAGCAGEGIEAPGVLISTAERDAARCEAQGLAPDSAGHLACVERAAAYRQIRRDNRGLATPSVRCTAGGNAGGCF